MLDENHPEKNAGIRSACGAGWGLVVEGACRKAVEKGGRVLQEKKGIGEYGFVAMLLDSEGNSIGLHSRI